MTLLEKLAELKAFREARAKATPGQWVGNSYVVMSGPGHVATVYDGEYIENLNADNDAAFIALAANEASTIAQQLEIALKFIEVVEKFVAINGDEKTKLILANVREQICGPDSGGTEV